MELKVRDDVIPLRDFVEMKFKYDAAITTLDASGGYAFKSQLADKDHNLPSDLIKANYARDHKWTNDNSYIYLTEISQKYAKFKDYEMCFKGIPKNKLVVSKLHDEPGDQALISSAIIYEHLKWMPDAISRENNILNKYFFNKKTEKFKMNCDEKGNENTQITDEVISKIKELRKNAKLIVDITRERETIDILVDRGVEEKMKRKEDVNTFICNVQLIDYGANISINHYLKRLVEIPQLIGQLTVYTELNINILSYSNHRASILKEKFETLIKDAYLVKKLSEELKYEFKDTTIKVEILIKAHNLIKIIGSEITEKRKSIPKHKLSPIINRVLNKEDIKRINECRAEPQRLS